MPRQYKLGHPQRPRHCLYSKGRETPKMLSHCSKTAPCIFFGQLSTFLLLLKKKKKRASYPKAHWILVCFHKDFIQPSFWETKLLNIHHKYFVNSHFCLILATSTFIVIIQWILFSMVEKRSLIGGMERNPASQAWTKPPSGSCSQDRFDFPPWSYGFPSPHNLWTFKSNWN